MIYSIIKKSQIESVKRLDAEYFQPEYLEVEKKLNTIKTESLENLAESILSFGAYSLTSNIEWQKEGIPYVNVGDIHGGYIDYSEMKYISEKVDKILQKSQLREKDIVLTMAGTIGNVAVVHNIQNDHINGNQAIAKIKPKKNVSPYYLVAFLNSRYGQLQILREVVSSVQANIFLGPIKKFKIPIFNENDTKKVESLYLSFLNELEKSKSLYSQAENLLLEELELKNYQSKNELWNVINLSKTKKVDRIDAEYFQPKYKILESKIFKHGHKLLEDVLENILAKFDPSKQSDKLFKYVELSNINSLIGTIEGYSEVLGKEAPSRAKRVLKKNDVIVSSVEGSLEKVALVNKEQEGYLASTGFFQFRSKEILPEVLLVLAKSIVFSWQLEKRCAGTILTAVPKESIKDVIIPILPKSIQQKIAELVQKSHETRKKAKALLEEAKHKVEELIENNQN